SNVPAFLTHFFWEQYRLSSIAIVAVLVLGGLGYAGFRFYSEREASDAAALLAAAKTPAEFQHVIDRYPGSESAASAYLLLAQEQREKKQSAEANATLHTFMNHF